MDNRSRHFAGYIRWKSPLKEAKNGTEFINLGLWLLNQKEPQTDLKFCIAFGENAASILKMQLGEKIVLTGIPSTYRDSSGLKQGNFLIQHILDPSLVENLERLAEEHTEWLIERGNKIITYLQDLKKETKSEKSPL